MFGSNSSRGELHSSGVLYSGKGYNGSVSIDQINAMIDSSQTFAFCLYKRNLTVARHTGILVYLDCKKAFSVDWGKDSLVGFNAPSNGLNIQISTPHIQEITMNTKTERTSVKKILHAWNSYYRIEHEYGTLTDNCRRFCHFAINKASEYHPLNPEGKESAQSMLDVTEFADICYVASLVVFLTAFFSQVLPKK